MIKSLFHYGFFRHIFLVRRNLHRAVCTGKRNITWLSEWSSFPCFLANICYMFADIFCSMHLEFKYKSQHKERDAILLLEETLTVCWINYIFGNHLIRLRCPGYIGTLHFWLTTQKKKMNVYWFQHSFLCKDEWSNYVWLYPSPRKKEYSIYYDKQITWVRQSQ